eukprot:6893173-Pyramimonas_sp.AAC.1
MGWGPGDVSGAVGFLGGGETPAGGASLVPMGGSGLALGDAEGGFFKDPSCAQHTILSVLVMYLRTQGGTSESTASGRSNTGCRIWR